MTTHASYEIDSRWRITRANGEFRDLFHCTDETLIGRDIRDLMRDDWRLDFRRYVARALAGLGDVNATVPMVAPSGDTGWYKHTLRPLYQSGRLQGYRATVAPHIVGVARPQRWWDWRPSTPRTVWDFDDQPLARAS